MNTAMAGTRQFNLLETVREGRKLQKAITKTFVQIRIKMYIPSQSYQMRALAEEAARKGLIKEGAEKKLGVAIQLIPNEEYNAIRRAMQRAYDEVVQISLPDPTAKTTRGIQTEFSRLIPISFSTEAMERLEEIREKPLEAFRKHIVNNRERFIKEAENALDVNRQAQNPEEQEEEDRLRKFIIDKAIEKINEFCKKEKKLFQFEIRFPKIEGENMEEMMELVPNSIAEQLAQGLFEAEQTIATQLAEVMTETKDLIQRELRHESIQRIYQELNKLKQLMEGIIGGINDPESLVQQRLEKLVPMMEQAMKSLTEIEHRKSNLADNLSKYLHQFEYQNLRNTTHKTLEVIYDEYGIGDGKKEDEPTEAELAQMPSVAVNVLTAYQEWLRAKKVKTNRGIELDRAIESLAKFLEAENLSNNLDMSILDHKKYVIPQKSTPQFKREVQQRRMEAIEKIEEMKQKIAKLDSESDTSIPETSTKAENTAMSSEEIEKRLRDYLS